MTELRAIILAAFFVGVMAIIPFPSCAHAPWSDPTPSCHETAVVDQTATEARGFTLVDVNEGRVFGDIPVVAGVFRRGEIDAEIHLLVPADLAEFLGNHGWARAHACTRRDGTPGEIVVKALTARPDVGGGGEKTLHRKDPSHGRGNDVDGGDGDYADAARGGPGGQRADAPARITGSP